MWDGTNSGLNIVNIGNAGVVMSFTYDPRLETPKNFRVIGRAGNKVNLGWDAVAGANGYRVYAEFKDSTAPAVRVNIGNTTGTSTYVTMADNCIYKFYVEALRNPDTYVTSAASNPIELSTDTVAPSTPGNLSFSNVNYDSVTLSWSGSTDNLGLLSYNIYSGTSIVATTNSTNYTVTGLNFGSTYSFTVKAFDLNNFSPESNSVSVKIKLETPRVFIQGAGGLSRTINWSRSSGADRYHVYVVIQSSNGYTRMSDLGYYTDGPIRANLILDCNYSYYVEAISNTRPDASSEPSAPLFISTDLTRPSAPTNLGYSNVTSKTVDLTWTASYDNLAVDRYDIYVNDMLYCSSTTNSCKLTDLVPGTSYNVKVIAVDKARNSSDPSNIVMFTTAL